MPLLIALVFPACGPAAAPPSPARAAPDAALDELLRLMGRRLAVMHDVAHSKWSTKSPIEDPAREKALLDDVAGRGRDLGLDPSTTRAFFAAQIEAAKLVQRSDFRRWESDPRGPQGDAPDLAGVLRPRIDALNRDLLAALARSRARPAPDPAAVRRRADALLAGEGIDAAVRAAAIRPLLEADR